MHRTTVGRILATFFLLTVMAGSSLATVAAQESDPNTYEFHNWDATLEFYDDQFSILDSSFDEVGTNQSQELVWIVGDQIVAQIGVTAGGATPSLASSAVMRNMEADFSNVQIIQEATEGNLTWVLGTAVTDGAPIVFYYQITEDIQPNLDLFEYTYNTPDAFGPAISTLRNGVSYGDSDFMENVDEAALADMVSSATPAAVPTETMPTDASPMATEIAPTSGDLDVTDTGFTSGAYDVTMAWTEPFSVPDGSASSNTVDSGATFQNLTLMNGGTLVFIKLDPVMLATSPEDYVSVSTDPDILSIMGDAKVLDTMTGENTADLVYLGDSVLGDEELTVEHHVITDDYLFTITVVGPVDEVLALLPTIQAGDITFNGEPIPFGFDAPAVEDLLP